MARLVPNEHNEYPIIRQHLKLLFSTMPCNTNTCNHYLTYKYNQFMCKECETELTQLQHELTSIIYYTYREDNRDIKTICEEVLYNRVHSQIREFHTNAIARRDECHLIRLLELQCHRRESASQEEYEIIMQKCDIKWKKQDEKEYKQYAHNIVRVGKAVYLLELKMNEFRGLREQNIQIEIDEQIVPTSI